MDEFHTARQAFRVVRQDFFESIRSEPPGERRDELIQDFRDSQSARLQELKLLRRDIRDAARDQAGGDRRPDDGG